MQRYDLNIQYHRENDIVEICGMKFAGDFFRQWALLQPKQMFRVVDRDALGGMSLQIVDQTRLKVGPVVLKCPYCNKEKEWCFEMPDPRNPKP